MKNPRTCAGPCDHLVQFYESHDGLVSSLAQYIRAGFGEGKACIIIATAAHRDALRGRLAQDGVDVDAGVADGRYVALDAEQTLASFMVGERPDPERFAGVIGPVLEQAARAGTGVCAFGEMVALLVARGNAAAAIELEELWNDLARTHEFSLLCAYPLADFPEASCSADFQHICRRHTHVLPAESFSALTDPDEQLRTIASLQQRAAALEREIQARRRAEHERRLRERELSDFLENAVEGLHRVGPDGTILWANRAELEMLGYPPQEYIGRKVAEFHADREVIEDILARLSGGQTLYNYPARLRARDGSIRHVLIHSNTLWENGRFVSTRCFTRDVTELRRLQDERDALLASERAARAEAERANRAKDEFVATLSHELRTPITAILGWVQLLQKRPAPAEELAAALETIERNARSQAQLVEELLDISRIAAGKLKLDVQQVNLASVVSDALESTRPAADAKSIRLQSILDAGEVLVTGDPTRLQQIVWNLLSNAVKFTPKGGHVRISLRRVESHVELAVSDNGKGIQPEFLPRLFSRFRQEDASTTRRYGGLGLGLAITKSLVELHGGVIYAASDGEGQGATFTVEFPVIPVRVAAVHPLPGGQRQLLASEPANDGAASGRELAGARILVVDDDADTRLVVRRLLEESGAAVATAGSVAEAMEIFPGFTPDVLLSDIGMADMDGYQLVRWVRSLPASRGGRTPAAALTALARSEDRTRALVAGYQVHVAKPIDASELIAVAASLAGLSGRPRDAEPCRLPV